VLIPLVEGHSTTNLVRKAAIPHAPSETPVPTPHSGLRTQDSGLRASVTE
jgi:hypothetical protein